MLSEVDCYLYCRKSIVIWCGKLFLRAYKPNIMRHAEFYMVQPQVAEMRNRELMSADKISAYDGVAAKKFPCGFFTYYQ